MIPHSFFGRITKKPAVTSIIIALLCIVIGAVSFIFLFDSIREQNDIARLDNPTLMWFVSHRSGSLTVIIKLITTMASPVVLGSLVAVASLIWAVKKREIWRPALLMGAMGLAVAMSTTIKLLVGRGRPPLADMIPPFEVDYSFPSGHTLGIAVLVLVAGYLVYSRRPTKQRLILWITVTILGIGLIAMSRLYLAYHWVTDIGASLGLSLVVFGLVIIIDTLRLNFRLQSKKALSSIDQ
ncbi:MAG: phosphatase PAP2 family protein [Candidatus Saccharibacteria bacterium]